MSRKMAFVLTALAVAGCSTSAGNVSTADAGKTLTGPEIKTLLSGNTVKGSSYVEFYDETGAVRGRSKGEQYAGSWRIEGDKVCVDMKTWDYDDCLTVEQKGTKYELKGDETKAVTVTIANGNEEGL